MRRTLPLSSAIKQSQSLLLEGEGNSPKASGAGVDASFNLKQGFAGHLQPPHDPHP